MDSPFSVAFYSTLSPISRLESPICPHSRLFWLREQDGNDEFCGLCWLIDGFQTEIPRRIHSYKLLAENGNPEMAGAFLSHANLVMGLVPPKKGQDLRQYRHARERLSRPAPGKFPVTSALWEMMGYQPPLAEPLVLKLYGLADWDIASQLGVSLYNVQIRLTKATRLALRYVRHDATISRDLQGGQPAKEDLPNQLPLHRQGERDRSRSDSPRTRSNGYQHHPEP